MPERHAILKADPIAFTQLTINLVFSLPRATVLHFQCIELLMFSFYMSRESILIHPQHTAHLGCSSFSLFKNPDELCVALLTKCICRYDSVMFSVKASFYTSLWEPLVVWGQIINVCHRTLACLEEICIPLNVADDTEANDGEVMRLTAVCSRSGSTLQFCWGFISLMRTLCSINLHRDIRLTLMMLQHNRSCKELPLKLVSKC